MGDFHIIKHEKSYHDRHNEYKDIFSIYGSGDSIDPSEIKSIWTRYFESVLEPVGWVAIWKISRVFCQKLSISFPTSAVLTMIDGVNFDELSADITVTDTGDSTDKLPSTVSNVPLTDLYVTMEQVNELNSIRTANCIDQLRFFYDNIWYAWDMDDTSDENWLETFLDFRLKMYYYSIDNNSDIKEHLWCLIKNASKLRWIIEEHYKMEEISDNQFGSKISVDQNSNFSEEVKYTENNCNTDEDITPERYFSQFLKIKNQLVQYENIFRNKSDRNTTRELSNSISIIVPPCSIINMKIILQDVAVLSSSSQNIKKITNNLQDALFKCVTNDTLFICSGTYQLYSIGNILKGGTLRGLYTGKRPVIRGLNMELNSFDFYKGEVILQDIVFHWRNCLSGIIVHSGCHIVLKNIDMRSERTSGSQAIVVLGGATLKVSSCHFIGFDVAIVCMPNSQISLNECIFENVQYYLKVFGDAIVDEYSCKFLDGSKKLIQHQTSKWLRAFY